MDPSPTWQDRFHCPSCSKSFVRKAHMLRHQQQHVAQRPFVCTFCSKRFKRSDVLRAHQFRCKARGEAPVPEGQSKGRKRSSCVSCVKLRTKCDQETPCTRCQELGKECVRDSHKPPDPLWPKSREAIPIHHLLNAPGDNDFVGRFPIRDAPRARPTRTGDDANDEDDEDDGALMDDASPPSEVSHWSDDYDRTGVLVGADLPDLDGVSFDSFFGSFETLTFGAYPLHPDLSQMAPGAAVAPPTALAPALESPAYETRLVLMDTAARLLSPGPDAASLPHLSAAIDLLTHTEVDHCIGLFFGNYHRHCPILHRPSFHAARVPIALLLAVVALGAMYSPEPAKVAWMKSLLDVMEAYIFGLPGMKDEDMGRYLLPGMPAADARDYRFQIFQGAYLMIVAQYFSGNLAARRRARRRRFSTVLSIARSLQLPTAQHPTLITIVDEPSFRQWVRTEIRVRTMNVMLAIDAAMSIFNNVPPRVNFCELDLDLPCHPQHFERASHVDVLHHRAGPCRRMKLIDAFQRLFVAPSDLPSAYQDETLCCWDMLYLSHVLYTHCWRNLIDNPLNRTGATALTTAPPSVLDPLYTALSNWKTLWDDIRARMTRSAVSEMGFETSADSYWTLTRLIVQKFDARSSSGPRDASDVGSDTTPHPGLHGIIGADDGDPDASMNDPGPAAPGSGLDFMPLEADCDSQGEHLRKILRR